MTGFDLSEAITVECQLSFVASVYAVTLRHDDATPLEILHLLHTLSCWRCSSKSHLRHSISFPSQGISFPSQTFFTTTPVIYYHY